jgi:hypothetical protein
MNKPQPPHYEFKDDSLEFKGNLNPKEIVQITKRSQFYSFLKAIIPTVCICAVAITAIVILKGMALTLTPLLGIKRIISIIERKKSLL